MSSPARGGAAELPVDGGARHLYVHVPFCRSRCAYCDFFSEPAAPHDRAGRVDAYLERLGEELTARGPLLAPVLATVYVGGGTPTALGEARLAALAADLGGLLEKGGEFTVEANPAGVSARLLEELLTRGVSRVSLGVQSFHEELRRRLGRRSSDGDVAGALEAVRRSGLPSWNLDLVFGVPGQEWAHAARDVDLALEAGAPHVSLYDLTYTTAYERTVAADLGTEARSRAEGFAEDHYAAITDRLEGGGLRRYEVSNFARPGHESRHNSAYWAGADYVGLGAGAVSTVTSTRWENPRSVDAYLEGAAPDVEPLDPRTRVFERAMLGLRTAEGVPEAELEGVLDRVAARHLEAQGFIQWGYGRLRLTRRGLDLSNAVLASILN